MNHTNNYILIDGSYFIFYRYYALLQWWNISKQEPALDNPCENERFIELYKTTFVKKINEISKKLKISNPIYIVGKDCPREKIWRQSFIKHYKGTRKSDNNVGYFFKLTYDENLFEKAGIKYIVSQPELEADDCIALTCKYINNNTNTSNCHNIYIIANDMDYVQLLDMNIKIYNLKYKLISNISTQEESKKYLFCKILMGDKSDNISPVFTKCGIKTAIKCYEDNIFFETKLNNVKESRELYERNRKIIDFNNIPQYLVDIFFENIHMLSL